MNSNRVFLAALLMFTVVLIVCCLVLPATIFTKLSIIDQHTLSGRREVTVPEFRPATPTEIAYRIAICLSLEALAVLLIWRDQRNRARRPRDILEIRGEPIQGELLMPIQVLEDQRPIPNRFGVKAIDHTPP
jgi:hypothetical protein